MRTTCVRLVLAALVLLAVAVTIRGEPPVAPLVMQRGAMVTYVRPGGPAAEAGLEVGDVILSVNGMVITSEEVLNLALKLSPAARLEVMKRDEGRYVRLLAFTKDGDLGIRVVMVSPETGPFFPRYRRWV